MSKNYSKACKAMERKPLNPIGSCFDSVGRDVLLNPSLPENAYVCHGIGKATMPGQEGQIMAHAWLECLLESGQLVAMDTTWGVMVDAAQYRKGASLDYTRTYTQNEFMINWLDFDYPGPWDKKILAIIERKPKKEMYHG